MALIAIKLLAIALILAVAVAGGMAALRTRASADPERWFALGAVFGGGVFLGAGLIHMLPDAVDQFAALYPGLDYPVPYALAAVGLIAILAIDRAGHMLRAREQGGASALILLFVLSFHSILAGAAIGAEDSAANSVVLLLAVLAHKGSAAFALTTRVLGESAGSRSVWPTLLLFSAMTPLGILLGAGLQEFLSGDGARLAEGLFDALAAATFVYVATLEVIGREFGTDTRMAGKFTALLAGLGVMALVAIWL